MTGAVTTEKGEIRTMLEDHLLYRVEESIAYFTINREKQRNAISPEVIELFSKYLDQAGLVRWP